MLSLLLLQLQLHYLQTRVDNVLDRFASVIAPDGGTGVRLDSGPSATAGVALDLAAMSFVQGPVVLEGANAIAVDNLAALLKHSYNWSRW